MSGCRQPADPRQDLRLAVDQLEWDALEIGGEVAARGALIGVPGEVELPSLHDVTGLGERETDLAGGVDPIVAARVIEVEMRVDHPANVVGTVTQLPERIL